MPDWTDEYRAKVRAFIAAHGQKVEIAEKRFDWQDDDDVSTYGWIDHEAAGHIHEGCRWIVAEGASLYERTYSQFDGTDADNINEVGVNVRGCECACGMYQKVILRWTGSVTEMLHSILGIPTRIEVEL